MKPVELMTSYLLGEKLEALIFILPLGLSSLVFGVWLLIDAPTSFTRGVAWPFVVLGLLLSVTGGTVAFRTPAQVERLAASFAAAPEPTRVEEASRMKKVNAAWPTYVALWASFAVVGLGLRFATRHDTAHGVGTALVFFAGVGLLIDGFAERRARPYTEALTVQSAQ
jgi:hypothetical protein